MPTTETSPDHPPADVVAANVRAEMARQRVTQADLAGRLGVSQATVSAKLTGRSRLGVDDLFRIAAQLHVSADTFMPARSASRTGADREAVTA